MKYFTVGPTQMYPSVKSAIESAVKEEVFSMSHRSAKFQDLFRQTTENLRKLLDIPSENSIFFLSSGTEGMERVIQNTVNKTSTHFVNGAFSKKFYETALELGKKPIAIQATQGAGFDFDKWKISKNSELICLTHNETSTGVMLDMQQVYAFTAKHKSQLIALDTVSSMPYPAIDYKKIDMVFFSVQKGFGMPAGLGVIIVSPRVLSKASQLAKKVSIGSYHSFISLKKYADKYQTPETPNVLDVYIFNKVIQDMQKKDINKIRNEIEKKSAIFEKFFESSPEYEYLVKDKKLRSKTIHVVKVSGGSAQLIKLLKNKGFAVSAGYGELKEDYIRIANFPAHSQKDIRSLIKNLMVI